MDKKDMRAAYAASTYYQNGSGIAMGGARGGSRSRKNRQARTVIVDEEVLNKACLVSETKRETERCLQTDPTCDRETHYLKEQMERDASDENTNFLGHLWKEAMGDIVNKRAEGKVPPHCLLLLQ
ncbi:hypothetical protein TNIN_151001 [Trichonephila inaurata madagascariensis]|uniref:Uncharacterized protein n=1 Tax=Trichonephila inaurata madagascariensis TaxID=2747483 RepID=A0A8X6Y066_9ARAC|nr:hypothetical protein TNIN_151001 [Trichonephila inaurata madagascariensis]